MTPVAAPISPAGTATSNAKQPVPLLLPSKDTEQMPPKIAATTQAPREQRSHPHHGRSDGLKGMAEIVAPQYRESCRTRAKVTRLATTEKDTYPALRLTLLFLRL